LFETLGLSRNFGLSESQIHELMVDRDQYADRRFERLGERYSVADTIEGQHDV
jgi:hypothetical protein